MRSFTIIPFFILTLGLLARAAPADTCDTERCRSNFNVISADSANPGDLIAVTNAATLTLRHDHRLTNGQRLARGLPLLPPKHLRGCELDEF